MSPRLLLIEDDPVTSDRLVSLLRQRWPAARLSRHEPSRLGPLPEGFLAAGFDAVLLGECGGLDWMAEIARRPGFAPVIFLSPGSAEDAMAEALRLGASASLGGDLPDAFALTQAVAAAVEQRKRQRVREQRDGAQVRASRFGPVTIRGKRLVRELSAGPLSSVYLAESEPLGIMLALKVLRQIPDTREGQTALDRFIQEYEVISRIDHPNVVRIHDLGLADDHAYLAMEYLPGGSLRDQVVAGQGHPRALSCLRQLASALQAIHRDGVLHRDLKPGNVMLRGDGRLVLVDFGIAKALALEAEITDPGRIFGTPYYMSPEQGHARPVDARSDLYSLGVMFHELLTGYKPYRAETPMAVIYLHGNAPVPRLPERLARYQPLLDRLMAKDPDRRFQDAGGLLAAIDALDEEDDR